MPYVLTRPVAFVYLWFIFSFVYLFILTFVFVRQGFRSSGIRGRSFFNVMTDTIAYLKASDLPPATHNEIGASRKVPDTDVAWRGSRGASALSGMGLSPKELLLKSQTMLVMEVDLVGEDLCVSHHAVSRGALDFFADAPFLIGGRRLRDVVCALSRVRDVGSLLCFPGTSGLGFRERDGQTGALKGWWPLTRLVCFVQLHMDDGRVVDAMVEALLNSRSNSRSSGPAYSQHRLRLGHFSIQPYVSPCSAAFAT
jgi:hypothetical protein